MVKNCKIYLSDEGFGPIIRQRAIINELLKLDDSLRFTIQTDRHLDQAKKFINNTRFIRKYNNITWHKRPDGSPDIDNIRSFFNDYIHRSDSYLKEELPSLDADFLISDFVYEAFEAGYRKKIPTFGVAHFTWGWFFSKLYPSAIDQAVIKRFSNYIERADVLYFPYFTPDEILRHYAHKIKQVPLIINKSNGTGRDTDNSAFKILLLDSGSGVMKSQIQQFLKNAGHLSDVKLYVSSGFHAYSDNVILLNRNDLFIDFIPQMDLVIGRAGFNTISECIACRTPMLLISEAMNPEMNENILNLKKEGLGSFISESTFLNGFDTFLSKFQAYEYKTLAENMKNHDIPTDGARVVAEDILNRIN